MPGFLNADNLVCDESEEDPRMLIGYIVEVCKRRSMKVNVDENKVKVLGGEEEGISV